MTSMQDVAKYAGVSVATVSNYLNNSKSLRPETKERVKKAIEDLNYYPNTTARSLKQNRSSEIGVILPSISDPYYAGVYKGIENIFRTEGNIISLSFTDEILENERHILASYLEKRVSGLIMVTCQPQESQYIKNTIFKTGIPTVFIDRIVPYLDMSYVCVDNYATILKLTKKLLKLGYRNICLITGPTDYSSESDCILAYMEAHKQFGIAENDKLICPILPFKEIAFDTTLNLFSKQTIDAVITTSQYLLDGILEALHILHLHPGKELPVISLSLDVWNEHTSYTNVFLTKRPAIDVGEKAALVLKENITTPTIFENRFILLEDNVNMDYLKIPKPSHYQFSLPKKQKKLRLLMEDGQKASFALENLSRDFQIKEDAEISIDARPLEAILDIISSKHNDTTDQYDIFMYDIPWLPSLANEGVLADITDYMDSLCSPEDSFSEKIPALYGKYNGKYYGIPFIYSPPILFYRKDLFEDSTLSKDYYIKYQVHLRPPKTWREFNTIANYFNEINLSGNGTEKGVCLYGQTLEHLMPNFLPRLSSFGGSIYDENLKIKINSLATRKALDSLFNTSLLSSQPFYSSTLVSATKEFFEGKTAMLCGHSSYTTEYNKDIRSQVAGKVGYAPLPGRTPHISGWGLGINAYSQNRELALKFFSWLTRNDISNYRTILDGQSLLNEAKPNSELLKVYPWLPLELESFNNIRPRSGAYLPGKPVIPRNLIEEALYRNICLFLTGKNDIDETVTNMELDLKSLFRQYGYQS